MAHDDSCTDPVYGLEADEIGKLDMVTAGGLLHLLTAWPLPDNAGHADGVPRVFFPHSLFLPRALPGLYASRPFNVALRQGSMETLVDMDMRQW